MDNDFKKRAAERRKNITFVREGTLADNEAFDWEYIKDWRKQPSATKIGALMELIHTSYAIKGIDVSKQRLQRSPGNPEYV